MAGQTTIRVSDETWERLDDRKHRGVTFDEVVAALLDEADADAVDERLAADDASTGHVEV